MTSRWIVCVLAGLVALACEAQPPPQPAPAPTPAPVKLTLDEAVRRVLQCHPDVLSAQAAIVQARAQAKIQQARVWPQVNLGYNHRENKSLGRPINVGGGVISSGGGRSTQRDLAVTLDYQIYDSARRYQIRQAEAQAAAQVFGLPDAQRLLAFETRSNYYNILANLQLSRALMQSVAASERHRAMVEARITEGVAPRSDLLPVLLEISQARLQAVQAETNLQTSEAALRALLRLPAGTPLELTPVAPAPPTLPDVRQLVAQADDRRPDVQQQELSIRAAQLATRVAEVQRGVQLSANATADYGRHTGVTGDSWSVQFGATYPLFSGGAAQATVTSARAAEEIQRQRLDSLLLQVQDQVETAYAQVTQAAAAVADAGVARQNAENNLAAAEARYGEGLAIIIEVTDAQVALLQAQVAEIQARLNQATALAALDQALGLVEAEVPAPAPAPAAGG